MKALLNILWFLLGGFWSWLSWSAAGVICYITIIGIPFGKQCFKMASYGLAPFNKHLEKNPNASGFGCLGNLIWVLTLGIGLFIAHLTSAIALAVTIIGIPFALKQLSMARLALAPFGLDVVYD